jgi:tetratricopeptide (TPR) repeat protein
MNKSKEKDQLNTSILKSMYTALVLAALAISTAAQTATVAPAIQEADALLQAQKWAEAAKAYEAITGAEPTNARAWYQLGWSRHGLGKYEQAIDAFQKALEINKGTRRASFAMYGIATMYAGLKDRDKAFEWLNRALSANLPQPRQIKDDPNLISLRDDPRFQTVLTIAEKAARVCMNTPEYRQLDFWVGEWNVIGPGNQQVGTNSVVLLEDGCIVEENWTSAQGGQTGRSFNFYNPVTHKWHQSYMGNDAGNWMMDGEYKDGAMRYEGAVYSPPNAHVLTRMTFFNLGPDKVRQLGENSTDGGKTWVVTWDAMYIRKK